MSPSIRFRLSVMMFLEYAIWASWYVTMGRYLGGVLNFTPQEIGIAYNATAIAAIISPFFVGMVADRFFATEKVLAVLHVVGGVLILVLTQVRSFELFYTLLIAHTLCYMPTLALTNSISFHQMENPGKDFPKIRVLGTISWIVTVWGIGRFAPLDVTSAMPFYVAGAVSVVMGGYCLTLPHTPPKAKGEKVTTRDVLGLDALKLLREPSFVVFVISAFLICIPLSFYFVLAPMLLGDVLALPTASGELLQAESAANLTGMLAWLPETFRGGIVASLTTATSMTIYGQLFEIFFMLIMPWFFVRLGVKWMLMVGMMSWGLRYFLFILGYDSVLLWPLLAGVMLHGICYDFFFVTAYIYTDQKADAAIRAKAQGFIALVTLGAGMFVGTSLSGTIADAYSFPRVEPVKTQAVAADSWMVGNYTRWESEGEDAYGRIESIDRDSATAVAQVVVFQRAETGFQESDQSVSLALTELSRPLPLWDRIWRLPAYGALVIMILFALIFRDKGKPTKDSETEA